MKKNTQQLQFVVEARARDGQKVPGFILTISASSRGEMHDALNAVGIGESEIGNFIRRILDQSRDALDGSVEGLIISSLEE